MSDFQLHFHVVWLSLMCARMYMYVFVKMEGLSIELEQTRRQLELSRTAEKELQAELKAIQKKAESARVRDLTAQKRSGARSPTH